MVGIKIAAVTGLFSTMGIVAQTLPAVPDDLKTWPATAILGLITLAALANNFFTNKKIFDAIKTLDKTANGIQELNAKLNRRPCMLDKE